MLKKMLVLFLVLGVSSIALAADLAISVNGQDAPPDSTIYLSPGQHLNLDIHAGADLASGWAVTWALIVNTDKGSISSANAVINPSYDNVEVDPPYDIGMVAIAMNYGDSCLPVEDRPFPMVSGVNGFFGLGIVFEGSIPNGTWLINDIDFQCMAEGDALIQLVQLDDNSGWPTGVVYDSITVHQIPEPATMLLLSLGGLLLRKHGK